MTNDIVTIKLSEHTRFPGARYKQFGPWSAEWFRDDLIRPVIDTNRRLVLDLSGCMGFGTGFLEECFGGLIRNGVNKAVMEDIINRLICEDDDELILRIKTLVDEEYLRSAI